jgi:hypothetical protein
MVTPECRNEALVASLRRWGVDDIEIGLGDGVFLEPLDNNVES